MVCGTQFVPFHAMDCPLAGAVEDTGRPWICVTTVALVVPVTSPDKVVAPACRVQEFSAVQAYRLAPAAAFVLKKASPTEQVAGKVVPDLNGLVVVALLKSTLFACVRKSTSVCALAQASKDAATRTYRFGIS